MMLGRVATLGACLSVAMTGTAVAGGAVSARADILPSGRLHRKVDSGPFGQDNTTSLETAFGVAARATLDLGPNVSVGLAPRVVFSLTEGPYYDVGKQFDLLGIVDVHGEAMSHTTVGAFATTGYSVLTLQPDPKGATLGFGVRGERSFGAQFLSLEAGYQLSFLRAHDIRGASGIPSQDVLEQDTVRLFHVGIGAGRRF